MRHIALCLVWDLESLEENRMIIERKIELLTAFEKGKTVEIYHRPDGKWYKVNHDIWDFEDAVYRIKSDRDTKFKVGDTLVFMRVAGEPNPFRYEITEVTDDSYKFKHVSPSLIKEVDETFISERDVLWYFEIYDYISKRYSMHPTRMTMSEMDE